MKRHQEGSIDTRERLLRAAGQVFARRGFHSTTVREIARKAQANVAAVSYHFGSKEGLYVAVLKYTLDAANRKYPSDPGTEDAATPEVRLRAFIRSILFRILDEGRPAWHGKLMAREMIEPTFALDQMIEETIRPFHGQMERIVAELMGPDAREESVRLCALSIIGQCTYFCHAQPLLSRLYPRSYGAAQIEQLADHITQFSLNAIQAFSKKIASE